MEGANLLGFANGTARGMGHARVAVYKVYWDGGVQVIILYKV